MLSYAHVVKAVMIPFCDKMKMPDGGRSRMMELVRALCNCTPCKVLSMHEIFMQIIDEHVSMTITGEKKKKTNN